MSGIIIVQSREQLEEMLQQSHSRPLFLYKHSSNCGSSRVASTTLHHFISRFKDVSQHFNFIIIRVIEDKPLSLLVTEEFNIPHVSPQLMLIKDRTVIWHVSHQQINTANMYNTAVQFLQQPRLWL